MGNLNGRIFGYTALFPIKADADCSVLRSTLRALDRHPCGSPFSSLDILHAARLVIIDRLPFQGEPAKFDRLSSAYLLFACDFDGSDIEQLIIAMLTKTPDTFLAIWKNCVALPPVKLNPAENSELIAYFRRCQITTTLYLVDQPDASVTHILRSLALARTFAGFIEKYQGEDPSVVQQRFEDMWQNFAVTPPPSPGSW